MWRNARRAKRREAPRGGMTILCGYFQDTSNLGSVKYGVTSPFTTFSYRIRQQFPVFVVGIDGHSTLYTFGPERETMSTPEQRRQVATRVRRYRAKHSAALRAKRERHLLTADPRPRGVKPSWRCVEWINSDGLPVRVFACPVAAVPTPPTGIKECCRWLPGATIPKQMAVRIVRLRIEVICQWAGGVCPAWLQSS